MAQTFVRYESEYSIVVVNNILRNAKFVINLRNIYAIARHMRFTEQHMHGIQGHC